MKRALLLLPLVLLAGCNTGTTPSPQVSLPPENPAPGDHETAFLDPAGVVRQYLVHAPPAYAVGKTYPLVLAFHGSGGEPATMADRTKLNEVADAHGFLVVYPDNLEDTQAVADLIDHVTPLWGVDPKRVHATGFSMGATFVYELAEKLTGRFGSVAPVSGVRRGKDLPPLSPPISLITFQGAYDRLSQAFTGTNNDWRQAAGCGDKTVTTITMEGGPTHIHASTCGGGTEHVVYSVSRMGHQWPGTASELIWEFFAKHPLR